MGASGIAADSPKRETLRHVCALDANHKDPQANILEVSGSGAFPLWPSSALRGLGSGFMV